MVKDYSISSIRFIAFFMIITCHILQGLNLEAAFWLNLGVQIFFFTSGYLYGKKDYIDYKKFYKARIIKILIPSSIIMFIMIVILKVFMNISYPLIIIIANLLGFGGFYGTIPILSHLWFISYILLCYLITPCLQLVFKNSNNNLKSLLIIIICLTLFKIFNVISFNYMWIINYIIGYFFSKCCITKKQKNCFFGLILSLSLILLPLTLIIRYSLNTNIPIVFKMLENDIWDLEHVLLGSSLFIILYKIFSKLNIKENFLLNFSDKYSFFIYLTHQIFILNYFSVLFLTPYLILNIVLIFILSILSGVALSYINTLLYNIITSIAPLSQK